MDCKEKDTQSEFAHVSQLFLDFMTRIAKYEELVSIGGKLLHEFHQELEILRKPPLNGSSKVADAVIKANWTERMEVYVDSGCRHAPAAVENEFKLHTCQRGLLEHLAKAKSLITELESLVEDAVTMSTASLNSSLSSNELVHHQAYFEKDEMESGFQQIQWASQYSVMMCIIHEMLNLDYSMQEKIVRSLREDLPSAQLESYSLMWDLHPFINDSCMQLAWKCVRSSQR